MTDIYIIRHGEAEGNVYRRSQGQYDTLLTPNGQKQAEILASRFADVQIDAIYASDLTRAWQTAAPLAAQKGLVVTRDEALRELAMGHWEDLPWGVLPDLYPKEYDAWVNAPHACVLPSGESMAELQERITTAILRIAAAHGGETIAIFTHGAAIRTFLCRAEGRPLCELSQIHWGENTCVARCSIEGEAISLQFSNDASHLPKSISTLARQRWWRSEKETDYNLSFLPGSTDENYILTTLAAQLQDDTAGKTVEQLSALISQTDNAFLAVLGNETAGFVLLEDGGRLAYIYLEPRYQRINMGAQLLGQAISVLRKKGCKTLSFTAPEGNAPIVKFAQNMGFLSEDKTLYTLNIDVRSADMTL